MAKQVNYSEVLKSFVGILRDYQLEAYRKIPYLVNEHRSVIACMPCGAGKTELAIALMLKKVAEGGRCLFFAHRRELVSQTARRLKSRCGLDVGIYMAGYNYSTLPIQVCSIQTMHARRYRPPADLIIIDEAHLSLSPSYVELAEYAIAKGIELVGLTATPYRLTPSEHFSRIYNKDYVIIQPQELIDKGYLLKPRWYQVDQAIVAEKLRMVNYDYSVKSYVEQFYKKCSLDNLILNYETHAKGLRTIVFSPTIEVAHEVAQAFCRAGYPFMVIDSKQSPVHNKKAIKDFAAGKIIGLSNVNMVSEGFDVPDCSCVILNIATASKARFIQAVGRCQRPGKDYCVVIDNSNHVERMGPPWQNIEVQFDPVVEERADRAPGHEKQKKKDSALVRSGKYKRQNLDHIFAEVPEEKMKKKELKREGFYTPRELANHMDELDEFTRNVVRKFGPIVFYAKLAMPAYFENGCQDLLLGKQARRREGYKLYNQMCQAFNVSKKQLNLAWEKRKSAFMNQGNRLTPDE